MLLTLGIGSVVALHNAVTTAIWDQMPNIKYWKVAICTTIVGYLMGIIYTTPGGQWMLTLVDYFGGTFIVFVLAIIELVAIFWVYGLENFCLDLEFMSNRKVSLYWRLCWGFVTPVLMIIIFVYKIITIEPEKYGGRLFPTEAYVAGWLLLAVGVCQTIIWGIWVISRQNDSSFIRKIRSASKPTDSWGPANLKKRSEWLKFKEEKIEERRKIAETHGHSIVRQKLCLLFGKY